MAVPTSLPAEVSAAATSVPAVATWPVGADASRT